MKGKQTAYHILLVLLLFLIIFVRSPAVLTLPSLRAEDGAKVFAYFYQNRDFGQLLRFRNGYIPLVANLIGFVSVRFPTRMTPYVLAWVPLFIALAAYSVFFHKRYAEYVSSDRLRFFICVLFALAPNGQYHLFALTDYSIWNTFLLLIFLSILRFPSKYRILFLLVYCVLIWSHPLAIVTLPASIFFFVKDRDNRVYYAVIILNHLFHQMFGVEIPQGLSDRGFVDWAQVAVSSLKYLADVSFLAFFGRKALKLVSQNAQFLTIAWAIAFLFTTLLLFRIKSFRKLCITFGYYIVSITTLIFLARGARVLEDISGSPRYFYIPVLFLLIIITTVLVHILTWVINRIGGRLTWSSTLSISAENIAIGLLVAHYFILNFSNLASYRYGDLTNGYIVRDFFQNLAEEEERLGSYKGIYLRADRIGDWSIIIDTRENKPPPITDTKVVYHDGYYHDGAGRYEEGVFPWMDLLAKLGDTWYGPERDPLDDIDAQPLPDGVHWECEGGFGCHPNGEAWWLEISNEGIARLIGPSGEVMIEVPLIVVFQSSGDG
jgi:hypothetical protein